MRMLGIIFLVLGLILLYFGYNSSQAITEQVVEGATGRYTQETMSYIIGGAILAVVGAALAFFKR